MHFWICVIYLLALGRERPAPMALSYRLGLVTWGYQGRIPVGTDICHRGCAYTVLQTVRRHGVYSAAYGIVHYKEPLKSFEIRVGHSPGFGLPSVAILPWLCRKRRKAIFIFIFMVANQHCIEPTLVQCLVLAGEHTLRSQPRTMFVDISHISFRFHEELRNWKGCCLG